MTIVLLDGRSHSESFVRTWLKKEGLVVWHATDVSDVVEELSDYTVGKRPDVVLLQVPVLPECFESLASMFSLSSPDQRDVGVVGLSDDAPQVDGKRFVAQNLAQVRSFIQRDVDPLSCAA
ncbi:MAG: hypothetical protein ABR530_08760 [Pyrinomonadaceae bacterium]